MIFTLIRDEPKHFGKAWFICDAPEFHQGPRPLVADLQARSSLSPRRIRFFARVNDRFHCRQMMLRSLRRSHISSSSKTFFTSAS